MKIEIKIPEVGESVQEALLAQWYKEDGDPVAKEEPLLVIETDKVTLEVAAEAKGVLGILVPEGETVAIGTVVGTLDAGAASARTEAEPRPDGPAPPETQETAPTSPGEAPVRLVPEPSQELAPEEDPSSTRIIPPSVRRFAAERGLDLSTIPGTGPGGRVTRGDVLLRMEESGAAGPLRTALPKKAAKPAESVPPREDRPAGSDGVTRKTMSPIRQRIASRLLEARRNTAMLTTFNEIDMSRLTALRARYKESFRERHGVPLGMMSFFIKATVEALKGCPELNAFIDGKDILYHDGHHIGVAVGSAKGLVVPVIQNADALTFAGIEEAIVGFVTKIKENRLELADLEGGTFTVSNGGIYGSLLSTPILNTPQSGILGMHKIEKRPVVVDDEVVVRPMMYVAMSYDHRIVDGREAVTFLKRIKECVEDPERIMMEI